MAIDTASQVVGSPEVAAQGNGVVGGLVEVCLLVAAIAAADDVAKVIGTARGRCHNGADGAAVDGD